jgi:PKD repeat protein
VVKEMHLNKQPLRKKVKLNLRKRRLKLVKSGKNTNNGKVSAKSIKTIVIALYITFLILSTIPFLADQAIEPQMKDSYTYSLRYPKDGRQTHYYVERVDTSQIGQIDLEYTTTTNLLDVKTTNIDVLHIYCRSMYEDECEKVFGFDPSDNSNYFKWYFIEKNHLIVKLHTDHEIKELAFIDTPIPYQVIVNGLTWYEGKQYEYRNNYATVLSNVPKGQTHVDLYFKSNDIYRPHADFDMDKNIVNVDTLVSFDASTSFDLDGDIIAYIWDFGDGSNSGGVLNAHSYPTPGTYGVILTVRDNDFLIDQIMKNITVIQGSNKPVINGKIPDQIVDEDAPPWELDLSKAGVDLESSHTELKWYLTGVNPDLYKVMGENSTEQKLIFSPIANAFGNDLVTLWLIDKDGFNDSQPLWINITPINDRPVIKSLPSLTVHYNVPYRFYLSNYIDDIETPKHKLTVTVQDQYGNLYVNVVGQDLLFNYPDELMNTIILSTVTVSDGEDKSQAIISVKISDNWPPVLKHDIPDIILREGESKLDVFNLDDYFTDPEGEELSYSYSESEVIIYVKENNSVNVMSVGDYTGEEYVIFRARDNYGGITEDMVKIVVLPINDPPEIGDVPDLKVHFSMDYYFDVSYYISDRDNSFDELTLTTSEKEYIRISEKNHLGIVLNYPRFLFGITSQVKLTVSDGHLEANKTIRVTVIEEYPPELVRKMPDITFNEDEQLVGFFDLDEYFLDFDNDSLYYTAGNIMIEIVIDNEHLISFSSAKDWYGTEKVVIRATDPTEAFVEDAISVTVLPVNDAPTLKPLPKITLNETEIVELDLKSFIIDVDTNISNINIIVEDPNVMVSGSSLVIFGSPELPKEVEIFINDGELTTMGKLKTKVNLKDKNGDYLNSTIITFIVILIIIIITILGYLGYTHILSQKYEIEEIFLIHNSGKLLNHMYYKSHSRFDDEIFSGMFTAIQGFIEDSFTRDMPHLAKAKPTITVASRPVPGTQGSSFKLNEFKVGDNRVIIEHGNFLFMAVVYNGLGATALHRVVKKTIKNIEKRFGPKLEYWNGDMAQIKNLRFHMEKLMPKKQKSNPHDQKPTQASAKTFEQKKKIVSSTYNMKLENKP